MITSTNSMFFPQPSPLEGSAWGREPSTVYQAEGFLSQAETSNPSPAPDQTLPGRDLIPS